MIGRCPFDKSKIVVGRVGINILSSLVYVRDIRMSQSVISKFKICFRRHGQIDKDEGYKK